MSNAPSRIRLPTLSERAFEPNQAPEARLTHEELSRRRFLKLVSASAALAAGCTPGRPEKMLPYTHALGGGTPGISSHYATGLLLDGFATGLVATTREGRPVKLEGNPAHPASLGATSVFHQASVLELYDPDRARAVTRRGLPAAWEALDAVLARPTPEPGPKLRLLLEPTSSPLVHALVAEVKRRFPEAKVTFFAPLPGQAPGAAAVAAYGERLAPQLDVARADVVLALDSDFLSNPHWLRHARDFAARRRPAEGAMNRLYALEAGVSVTGSMADTRLARPARRVAAVAAALLEALGPADVPRDILGRLASGLDEAERRFVAAVAADLRRAPRGSTLVVAGERQPPALHVLAYALNRRLGNLGTTLAFADQAVADDAGDQDLRALVREMHAGDVDVLLVLGGNPAYTAPADFEWPRALAAVETSVAAGLHVNETAKQVTWFAPLAHAYETWGDGRSYDGTYTLAQPLIRPLFGGRSVTELLARVAGRPELGDYERLRAAFGRSSGEPADIAQSAAERVEARDPRIEQEWERLLGRGFDPGTAHARRVPEERPGALAAALAELAAQETASAGIELDFTASPTLGDGRYANNAWLLELPAPVLKLTWDNAAFMSPRTAARLGVQRVERGEPHPVVELERAGRRVRAPAVVLEAHADDAVTVWLGYGRSGAERLAAGVGFDAYRLRTSEAPHFAGSLRVRSLEETYPLAFSQLEENDHDRTLALTTTLAEYRAHPDFTAEHKRPLPSLLPEYRVAGPQWALTIDLGACTGCSACVVACQAENNLLVVGKDQVRRGRIMHWLRVDTYRKQGARGRTVHQPMMCQHCEDAPCEYVCPVNATVHSPDGLNEMVYNRCVGTRFCSNNCPYKVRRFNWFDWSERVAANRGTVELQRNPEVSVRERGVMEKCTYCVQRIRAAEIRARLEHRPIAAGEVESACAQVCPTRAIRFGSLTHEKTPMVVSRAEPRSYFALHETGARPRTMYLARIDNPSPEQT